MVYRSFDLLRRAGFQNINIDLMFAIPGQTLPVWRNTLREALALASEHLSSYEVIYEEDTPLYEQLKAGQFDLDEDLACAMYEELVDYAHGAGFIQYEIANFARQGLAPPTDAWEGGQLPSKACRHNVNYWRGGSFYGLGPSATSYVRGERTKNWSNTELYCQELNAGRRAVESREHLEPLARAGETAAFGLRMVAGWGFEEFRKATGYDLRQGWTAEMHQLSLNGLGLEAPDRFQLTRRGLRFADTAAELFLR
jgi:oxygen-independent coproporphyrinogen-3 oxidase